MNFQVMYLAFFCQFSVIDRFKWFLMGILCKKIQPILGLLNAPFLGQNVFLPYINDPRDDVVLNIAICVDGITLYSNCELLSDML